MKRFFAMILAAWLLVSMTGCAQFGEQAEKREDRNELRALLDQVAENIKEADSPITAKLAADFVSWACSTEMTQKEVAQEVSDWLSEQSPSIRLAAEEKLNAVMDSIGKLLDDGTQTVKSGDIQSILNEILASGGL
ncbi:MAG: hypothetical protein ACI3XG_03515 [Faecousia sp.]